jgi:hypothetical protein
MATPKLFTAVTEVDSGFYQLLSHPRLRQQQQSGVAKFLDCLLIAKSKIQRQNPSAPSLNQTSPNVE